MYLYDRALNANKNKRFQDFFKIQAKETIFVFTNTGVYAFYKIFVFAAIMDYSHSYHHKSTHAYASHHLIWARWHWKKLRLLIFSKFTSLCTPVYLNIVICKYLMVYFNSVTFKYNKIWITMGWKMGWILTLTLK